ncbi:105R [Snake adenovirus 1]|uniref:Protein 105R n=1 Tax=Snake adenovirus serotype 1 TaxID=189830 RepID=105R_ADES1|nr:105R [Snake adenovirus 1]A9CBA2.1 RecName: Full=Protein 105R; Flags: Precursor [Snake adenovirus 1]ABA47252.1 105R [Snake adenovirus 1]
MYFLFFFLLFLFPVGVKGVEEELRALEGEDVSFYGEERALAFFLLIGREDGKFQELCSGGNCSSCSAFAGRVRFKERQFTLSKVQVRETGTRFKVRSRHAKGNSTLLCYKLTVAKFRPVLVPVVLSGFSIGLSCVDHSNPWGFSAVFIWDMNHRGTTDGRGGITGGKKWVSALARAAF